MNLRYSAMDLVCQLCFVGVCEIIAGRFVYYLFFSDTSRSTNHLEPPSSKQFGRVHQMAMSNTPASFSEEIEMRPADAGPVTGEAPQNKRANWFQRWRKTVSSLTHRMNTSVARSPVGRLFRLKGSGHVSFSSPLNPVSSNGQK
jgi:hypothetical protein